MENFKKFLSEQSDEKPYKLIVFQNSGDDIRDVKDSALGQLTELLKKAAKSANIEIYFVDFTGLYVSKKKMNGY